MWCKRYSLFRGPNTPECTHTCMYRYKDVVAPALQDDVHIKQQYHSYNIDPHLGFFLIACSQASPAPAAGTRATTRPETLLPTAYRSRLWLWGKCVLCAHEVRYSKEKHCIDVPTGQVGTCSWYQGGSET